MWHMFLYEEEYPEIENKVVAWFNSHLKWSLAQDYMSISIGASEGLLEDAEREDFSTILQVFRVIVYLRHSPLLA